MTIDQFFTKYNGKYIDVDGFPEGNPFQCVDLMRQFQVECLGVPPSSIPPAGYAKDIFKNFKNNQYFTKVYNGPYNAPEKGDIVFWNPYPFVTGWAGHVAICSTAGSMALVTFDQNYGNPNFCRFVNHSYRGILGWLRRK